MHDCFIVNLDKLTYAGNLEISKDFCSILITSLLKAIFCDSALVAAILDENKIDAIINFAAKATLTAPLRTENLY